MWRRFVLREAMHLVLLVAWLFLLHRTVSAFEVEGASMEPTLRPHEFVVVDTIASASRVPQRGEVIVFRYPRDPSVEYVKRVVGLPGEAIAVAHGQVWVDGQALTEPYRHEIPRYSWGPVTVPPHTVFVLGDNRNSSSDSHLWGSVPLGNVVGRAWFAYQPMAEWKWLAGQAPHIEASQRYVR